MRLETRKPENTFAMNSITAVVVDDEEYICTYLRNILKKNSRLEIVGQAHSVGSAVDLIVHEKPDLCLLDIDLGLGSAFDVMDELKKNMARLPEVILVTAYSQYALNAYNYGVRDYILKAQSEETIYEKIDKVVQGLLEKFPVPNLFSSGAGIIPLLHNRIIVPTGKGKQFVPVETITHIEGERSQSKIVCADGKEYIMSYTLQDFEMSLQEHHFVRVHKSYVVNFACIESVYTRERQMFLRIGNTEIRVGDAYRKNLPGV